MIGFGMSKEAWYQLVFNPIDRDQHSATGDRVFSTCGRVSGIVHSRLCLFEIKISNIWSFPRSPHSSFVLGPVRDIP